MRGERQMNMKKQKTLFNILAILLLVYMIFSAVMGYVDFINYCKAYELEALEQWFTGFRSITAAVIPCLVYSALLYGMGLLLGKKED